MSCLYGKSAESEYPIITQGGAKKLNLQMIKKDPCDPCDKFIDITGASAIKAIFLNTDSTFLEKTLGAGITVTNGPFGMFQIALTTAETALLALSPVVGGVAGLSDVEVHVTIGGEEAIYNLLSVVQIIARRYPSAA